jgi:GntR family transcriptional regulator of arabinose operon
MWRATVQNRIGAEIRKRIADGLYAPGSKLPSQRLLAREFATSPTTISRALAELEAGGLIAQKPRAGTHVIPLSDRSGAGAVAILVAGENGAAPPPASYRPILDGVRKTLARRQQHACLAAEFFDPALATPALLMKRYAGALFIQGLGFERLLPELEARRFPCVVAKLEKDIPVSCTWVDHAKSTQTAVRILAHLGHSRIALLTRSASRFFYGKAIEGYREALEREGIAFDPGRLITVPLATADGAYRRMRDYLARRPAPTAIVAARDYLACGAARALTEKGLRIGTDVSLIGFDNTSWPTDDPFLTTFAEPDEELGAEAAAMLSDRLVGGWAPPEKREIEAPLILRRSAGPCGQAERRAPERPLLLRTSERPLEVEVS